MWDNECQRLGKRKCTPLGAWLHSIAELIGFLCLLSLPCILLYLAFRGVAGTFHYGLWLVLAAPFAITLLGDAMFAFSWHLARRRGFEYDSDLREARWNENGDRIVYRCSSGNNRDSTRPDHGG
ncbi:hypothetical protein Poly51_59850 [Rubripirellula tenax]|uniref:Uncharacterized protein n=2 Tax=Rubripirellula tenax TaxID=2528015 RepID=A0A5C6EB47_9BACT|nr:hypothetical protein Poly51_59850 [Rubripirellula tenax]